MARNFKRTGAVLEMVAPAGGVVSGTPVLIGTAFVIPLVTAAVGEIFNGQRIGEFVIAANGAQAWAAGDEIYWDPAGPNADNTNVGATAPSIGYCATAKGAAAATHEVVLIGQIVKL